MTAPRVVVRTEDGQETDVTNAVTILWDGVVGSLDWGSGFWSAEDAGAVAWIGQLLGFARPRRPDNAWALYSDDVYDFAQELAAYERARAAIDANLPELP